MPKGALKKAASVSFSDEEDNVFEIPLLSQAEVPSLFYSVEEISAMKDEVLMEMAGVSESVLAQGQNLFEVEGQGSGNTRRQFRRQSLEKVISKSDLSPIRPVRGKSESEPKEDAAPTGREPRERPTRERGAPQRSRSSAGPSRTDGRRAGPGGGRGPPRRAKSSLAATSRAGEAVSLQQMQAHLAATGTSVRRTSPADEKSQLPENTLCN
jgi:hypothetical protein